MAIKVNIGSEEPSNIKVKIKNCAGTSPYILHSFTMDEMKYFALPLAIYV